MWRLLLVTISPCNACVRYRNVWFDVMQNTLQDLLFFAVTIKAQFNFRWTFTFVTILLHSFDIVVLLSFPTVMRHIFSFQNQATTCAPRANKGCTRPGVSCSTCRTVTASRSTWSRLLPLLRQVPPRRHLPRPRCLRRGRM